MAFYSLNTSDVPTKFFLDDELESLKSIKLDELPDLSTEEAILQQYESKLLSKKEPPPKPPKKNNNTATTPPLSFNHIQPPEYKGI